MIESIQEEQIVARCAACEKTRDVSLTGLVVQTLDRTTAIVALPPCGCGAVEYLIRAERPEHPDPGSEGHRHQLLVDHLHAELVRRERVAPASIKAGQICEPVAPAMLARWFPDGLCLRGDRAEEPAR